MTKKLSAIKATIYWTIAVIVVGIISGIIADSGASGGEQKLFVYVAYSVAVSLVGIVLINLVILFFYRSLGLKNRLFSLCSILLSLIFLYPLFEGAVGSQYNQVKENRYVGSDKIEIKTEYYISNDTSEIIRSRRFWKNGKKDSVWTIYDRTGNIVEQVIYKDDRLIEFIK